MSEKRAMSANIEVLWRLDELVEAARLLGATQAKKLFGERTEGDRRFERVMYESIDKHRAALLDWGAKQPAPQQPAAVNEAMVELARKARRLQRDHFGDGTSLHLVMMEWAREYDALAAAKQPASVDEATNYE